jgi:hypothetical protein
LHASTVCTDARPVYLARLSRGTLVASLLQLSRHSAVPFRRSRFAWLGREQATRCPAATVRRPRRVLRGRSLAATSPRKVVPQGAWGLSCRVRAQVKPGQVGTRRSIVSLPDRLLRIFEGPLHYADAIARVVVHEQSPALLFARNCRCVRPREPLRAKGRSRCQRSRTPHPSSWPTSE